MSASLQHQWSNLKASRCLQSAFIAKLDFFLVKSDAHFPKAPEF